MLSNKKGQMTNAIYGFLATFQKLLNEIIPNCVAVAFDLPAPTFRHKMYDGYKATRKKMPEELAEQLPILKELLSAMGYKLISLEGYEADDILGTFAGYCEKNNYDCVLATGDRDSLQLVSDNVTVRIASTKFGKSESTFYDKEKIKEVYGILPHQLIDVKALQGDSSDNIPGVKGIGEKTAKELIGKFGSINYIYDNIDSLDIKESIKTKLINDKSGAFMSYELGKINKEVPLNISNEDYIPQKTDVLKVKKMLTELEFFSFMEKMNLNSEKDDSFSGSENININFVADCSEILEKLKKQTKVIFITQVCGLKTEKIFIGIENKVYVLDFETSKNFKQFIFDFLNLNSIEKVTYDLKTFAKSIQMLGLNTEVLLSDHNIFDVMLASYLLNPSLKEYDLSHIAGEYEIYEPKICFENTDEVEISEKDKEDINSVYFCSKILDFLKKDLKERNQINLLFDIEQPLSVILANMENEGFAVDKAELEKYSINLENKIDGIKSSIYSIVGFDFNINSPKQLGTVLFEKLGLPAGKKGKTGYSTNASTLEKLKGMHEIIDLILEYRMLTKLKSTYCDGMINLITPQGRIHSSFNQTETRTGRISSAEPNLQNIPVRTEIGRELRKFFKAEDGCKLIDADYSQIELRVLAHLSNDENMIGAFKDDKDIHSITASQILNVPINMITPEMRFRAKAVNFGIIYGMGAFSLAQDLKISRFEAQNYINRYLGHYKGIDKYMNNIINLAKERGYAETMLYRRRYLPELDSSNHNLRAFGERVARNMPIQGTAADIIKIAMINTYKSLKEKKLKSKIILQVHDELIIEAPESEVDMAKSILKKEMENAVKMNVPLKVHVSVGKTWFDAKD